MSVPRPVPFISINLRTKNRPPLGLPPQQPQRSDDSPMPLSMPMQRGSSSSSLGSPSSYISTRSTPVHFGNQYYSPDQINDDQLEPANKQNYTDGEKLSDGLAERIQGRIYESVQLNINSCPRIVLKPPPTQKAASSNGIQRMFLGRGAKSLIFFAQAVWDKGSNENKPLTALLDTRMVVKWQIPGVPVPQGVYNEWTIIQLLKGAKHLLSPDRVHWLIYAGSGCFAMPFFDISFADTFSSPPDEPPTAAFAGHLAKLLLTCLAELHSYKVLHRDIKPQNIMGHLSKETKSLQWVLLDYDVAIKEAMAARRAGSEIVGTAPFWSARLTEDPRQAHQYADDLEAMAFVLWYALRGGSLPWPCKEGDVDAIENQSNEDLMLTQKQEAEHTAHPLVCMLLASARSEDCANGAAVAYGALYAQIDAWVVSNDAA